LRTPIDLTQEATRDVSAAMKMLLADVVALYVQTKNFDGHMSGPHFHGYHRLLDEQTGRLSQ
jgi:starvation-inducible DNA-binding protein